MFWDEQYKKGDLWGNEPSELARFVSRYLREHIPHRNLTILDVGCGYGRDALYLSEHYNCTILGIDISGKAVDTALKAVPESLKKRLEFRRRDFKGFDEDRYDIVFSSNLYQLLRENERREFAKTVSKTLKPSGLLFLSTLSVNDPEHSGKGTLICDEPNSYQDVTYLHLCAKEELEQDFAFLEIKELFEHEFYEPRITGEIHHHVSWILIGRNPTE